MVSHRLEVVTCPEDTLAPGISFHAPKFAGPVIIGTSTEDYACGHCGDVIFAKVVRDQVSNMTVKCFGCGTCNRAN